MNNKTSRNKPHRVTPFRATRSHQAPIIISSSTSSRNSRKRRRAQSKVATCKQSKRYTDDRDESVTMTKSSVIINLIEELNEKMKDHVIVIDSSDEDDRDDDVNDSNVRKSADIDIDDAEVQNAVEKLVNELTKDDLRHVIADMLKIMWQYRDAHDASETSDQ